jgi:hypothetical protein
MQRERRRWQMLCEQAMTEQDPERLMELIREINRDLEAKDRLTSKGSELISIPAMEGLGSERP